MTKLLEKAFKQISTLPTETQNDFASWLFAELEDENKWNQSFKYSASSLEKLAQNARLGKHSRL